MSYYTINIDDDKLTEQIQGILNEIFIGQLNHRCSETSDVISCAVKDLIYSRKDEIIEKVVDRATKEIVRKGLPKLLERSEKQMTDKEIIKALECCLNEDCDNCPNAIGRFCGYELSALALDYINRQQEQLESTIAGQESLQKALAEKNAEIERRKNNLFCKVVIDEEKMRNIINEKVAEFELDIELIKAEAIKECIEKTQAFLAIKCRGVVEDNPNLDEILWGYRKEDVDEFFDNLVKEMAGDAE